MDSARIAPIPGHGGYYADTAGRIYSAWTGSGRGSRIGDELRLLRTMIEPDGRERVNLRRRGYRVAHLVLTTFRGPRPAGMQACHFPDPDPANNRLENLRWDTPSANQGHDKEVQGASNHGVRNGSARLTERLVREIRERAAKGEPHTTLAAEFSVSRSAVQQAVARITWKKVA